MTAQLKAEAMQKCHNFLTFFSCCRRRNPRLAPVLVASIHRCNLGSSSPALEFDAFTVVFVHVGASTIIVVNVIATAITITSILVNVIVRSSASVSGSACKSSRIICIHTTAEGRWVKLRIFEQLFALLPPLSFSVSLLLSNFNSNAVR
jgi:hypothetical protein